MNERYGRGLGESDESREREARLGKWAKRKNATGAGKKGSSVRVVWKLLAGIEDGFR